MERSLQLPEGTTSIGFLTPIVQAQEQLMINFSNAGMELRELFSHLLFQINHDLSERVSGLRVMYSSMHDTEKDPLIGKRCTNLTISSQNKKSYKLLELRTQQFITDFSSLILIY